MSRYDELEKLKESMGKGQPKKEKAHQEADKKEELQKDADVNGDGEVTQEDVELVQKEARKKKVIKKEEA